MMERKTHFFKFVQGNKYKTMDEITQLVLNKLIAKLLGLKK